MLHLNVVHSGCPRCGSANVECAHGELGTGLANRLGRNNANCLTDIHEMSAG